MGFRFRKSIKIGPARVTLSKKGVGGSIGVRGARVGIGADGRRRATASIPGTNLSYTTTSGRSRSTSASEKHVPPGHTDVSSPVDEREALFVAVLLFGLILWIVLLINEAHWSLLVLLLMAEVAAGVVGVRHRRKRERERTASEAAASAEQARIEGEQRLQQQRANEERWQYLERTYGMDAGNNIIHRNIWLGATEAMIWEMFGQPVDVKEKVLKRCVRRNLRYFQTAKNRYALKIDIENGLVTGWERSESSASSQGGVQQ